MLMFLVQFSWTVMCYVSIEIAVSGTLKLKKKKKGDHNIVVCF